MRILTLIQRVILSCLAFVLLISCVTSIDLIDVAQNIAKRSRGPLPESEWNALGIWQRVADNPATYIPKGYPITAPRGDKEGTWAVDQRDGKRLFVPKEKIGNLEPSVLMGEAQKISQQSPIINTYTRPGILIMP